ncbi:hypothetical protein J6590_071447 [Homalodisca vitripennis]|nr:hypothetical protein J6590_071447 [Homalodisca vitripennis]
MFRSTGAPADCTYSDVPCTHATSYNSTEEVSQICDKNTELPLTNTRTHRNLTAEVSEICDKDTELPLTNKFVIDKQTTQCLLTPTTKSSLLEPVIAEVNSKELVCELASVTVKTGSTKLTIIGVYRPSHGNLEEALNTLSQLIDGHHPHNKGQQSAAAQQILKSDNKSKTVWQIINHERAANRGMKETQPMKLVSAGREIIKPEEIAEELTPTLLA